MFEIPDRAATSRAWVIVQLIKSAASFQILQAGHDQRTELNPGLPPCVCNFEIFQSLISFSLFWIETVDATINTKTL